MTVELSRKAARLFNEYRVPDDKGWDWGLELMSAKSEKDLSPELQQFLADPYPMTPAPSDLQKHQSGKHDQATHAGRKSFKSIDDLVKNGMSIQDAVDGIYNPKNDKVVNGNVPMRVLLENQGKGGKPEVVGSVDELDGEPMYRGTMASLAESYVEGDYDRIGLGGNGDGYYFSNLSSTAGSYNPDAMITAGWKKDAKVMRYTNPETSLSDYGLAARKAGENAAAKLNVNGQQSEAQAAVFDNFYKYDADAYVTSLILDGYDGVEIAQPSGGENFTIVFNREATQVVSN